MYKPLVLSLSARGVELCKVVICGRVDIHLLVQHLLPVNNIVVDNAIVHLLTLLSVQQLVVC